MEEKSPAKYISAREAIQVRVYELRNFAIHSELECTDVGTNAKMNEMQALMGPAKFSKYASHTSQTSLIPNYAYCPAFFKNEVTREKVYNTLHEYNVFTRRYFYPLLTDFAPYIYGKGACPIAEDLGKRVLTLPTYFGLTTEDATAIAENIKEIVK